MNNAFLKKLVCDELKETLFFATGEVPEREKFDSFIHLCAGKYSIEVESHKRILVNGNFCTSGLQAKWIIQEMLHEEA